MVFPHKGGGDWMALPYKGGGDRMALPHKGGGGWHGGLAVGLAMGHGPTSLRGSSTAISWT